MREWREIEIHGQKLLVSNAGNVRTNDRITCGIRLGIINTQLKRGVPLRPWKGSNGYLYVSIQTSGIRKKFTVHRLVGKAFIPNPNNLLSINHKDGNKINNRVDNLEWCTLARNTQHEWETGLVDLRGESHPSAKITAEIATIIRDSKKKPSELAKEFGVSVALVYKIRKRQRWASLS